MISQDKIRDNIFCLIGDIQISPQTKKKFSNDPSLRQILELREKLLVIADQLKSIYWQREYSIRENLLPIRDDGKDVKLLAEYDSIRKKICDLNCDIVWTQKGVDNGMESKYTAAY